MRALNTLYKSLVGSVLEYASFLPRQLSFIDRLNKVQATNY